LADHGDLPRHQRLRSLLCESGRIGGAVLADDTSLIGSGLVDSLALFNLAAWVEREVGRPLDLTSFDLGTEWDTMASIVRFIERQRGVERPAADPGTTTG